MTTGLNEIDAASFRAALGHFCTGVTVVTSLDGTEPVGFACQSFSALSLDPPLVLFCPAKRSRTWPAVERTGRFVVNVLAEEQRDVSATFGTPGMDRFGTVEWEYGDTGLPVLSGVLTWVDCELQAVHDGGDHHVVVGRVTALGDPSGGSPLLFYRGHYTAAEPYRSHLPGLGDWATPYDWL